MKKYLLKQTAVAIMILAAALAGCDKEPDNTEPRLEIDPVKMESDTTVNADATTAKGVTFITTGAWTSSIITESETKAAGDSTAWVSISPDHGDTAGEYTVSITLKPNTTGADRSATIKISGGGTDISLTIVQKATRDDETVPASSVTLNTNTDTLWVNRTLTLTPTVYPESATDKTVTWSSSDDKVATVIDAGIVTAVGTGTAIITATTTDGGFTAMCSVTVKAADELAKTMTMITAISGYVSIYLAGTGTAVIDWGDGSAPQTVTLSTATNGALLGTEYTHTFSGTTSRTITIAGQNITHLDCFYLQLTGLDVTNNTALYELRIQSNQFEAPALNALFGTLHSNAGTKRIYIRNNPGTAACDQSIATAKGWTVETDME